MTEASTEKAPHGAEPLECKGRFSIGVEFDKDGEPLFVGRDVVTTVDYLEQMLREFRIREAGNRWVKERDQSIA
jgi:hypothetical protein